MDRYKYHVSSIRRTLLKYGLFERSGAKKPLLIKMQISTRLKWCKQKRKNTMFHWKKVIYSDESRIEIRIHFVRRLVTLPFYKY